MSIRVDELRQANADTSGTATRMFRVWTSSPVAALGASGLPAYLSGHPDNPAIVRTTMQATREPQIGACIVTANYLPLLFGGAGGGGDQTPFDTVNIVGRQSVDVTTSIQSFTVPVLRPSDVRAMQLNAQDPPPSPAFRKAWRMEQAPVATTQIVLTLRTSFAQTPSPGLASLLGAFDSVTAKSGMLHVINGKAYAFSARLINQSTEGDGEPDSEIWNAEYSWTYDPGVRLPDTVPGSWAQFPNSNAIGNDDIRMPAIESALGPPGQFYIRPPYSDVLTGRLSDPDADVDEPEFFARVTLKVDPDGPAGLPGVTL